MRSRTFVQLKDCAGLSSRAAEIKDHQSDRAIADGIYEPRY